MGCLSLTRVSEIVLGRGHQKENLKEAALAAIGPCSPCKKSILFSHCLQIPKLAL